MIEFLQRVRKDNQEKERLMYQVSVSVSGMSCFSVFLRQRKLALLLEQTPAGDSRETKPIEDRKGSRKADRRSSRKRSK